jgi:hypothetical protein
VTNIENELALLDVVGQLASAAQDQWTAKAIAFRPFALFEPKEVVQTRIIAGLLDPGGSHGQGDNFLQFFLEEIGEDTGFPRALGSSQITTEALTESIESDRRRIDLLIRLPNGRHIALESKARNAEDQPGQIESYLNHLEVVAPKDHLLIYLSPREGKPADVDEDTWIHWTKGDAPRVRSRSYHLLLSKWLGKCLAACSTEAATLRGFLEQFCHFVDSEDERGALMGNELTAAVASAVTSSRSRLIAAMAINNSREMVRRNLAKRFLNALEATLKPLVSEAWLVEQLDEEDYLSLRLRLPSWKHVAAVFQIGPDEKNKSWEKTIGLGINGGGKNSSSYSSTAQASAQAMSKTGRSILPGNSYQTDGWAWFREEFHHMSLESVDCLLYDMPQDEVQRLAELLARIGQSIRQSADEYEANQNTDE